MDCSLCQPGDWHVSCWYCQVKEWPTLIGAFLGGLFALWVALIVARDARHRAERSAAMTLVRHLAKVTACGKDSLKYPEGRERGEFINASSLRCPIISPAR
jgi:hypothetical protein